MLVSPEWLKMRQTTRPDFATVAPSDNIKKAIDVMVAKKMGSVFVV